MHDEGSNQVSRISSPLGSESSPAKLLPPRPIFGAPRNKGAFFRSAGTPTISTPSAGKASYRSRLGGPICVVLVVINGWSTPHPSPAWMLSPLDGGWNLGILESRPGTDVPFRWEEEVPTWLQHHGHAVQHNPLVRGPLPSEKEACLWPHGAFPIRWMPSSHSCPRTTPTI